jgi:Zn-dependent peptidase ImmA (M78 family)
MLQITEEKLKDWWEERANQVLSNFKFNYPHEIDLYEICWRYGIKIKVLKDTLSDNIEAFSISNNIRTQRGIIFIKKNLPVPLERVILAEEFCHLYSHYVDQTNVDVLEIGKTELQAKRMAAYILMPTHFLIKKLSVIHNHNYIVSEIAEHFIVTEEFANYRLKLFFSHHKPNIYS